jgi:hypothetical protein
VEIGRRGLQGRPVDGNCMVGLTDNDLQVKAVSESVHCYSIRLPLLLDLLARFAPASKENSTLDMIVSSAVASPVRLDCSPSKENRPAGSETLRDYTSLKKRSNLRSTGELGAPLLKERRLHLKKHFSNFYN